MMAILFVLCAVCFAVHAWIDHLRRAELETTIAALRDVRDASVRNLVAIEAERDQLLASRNAWAERALEADDRKATQ